MSNSENKEICKLIDINKDAAGFYEDAQGKAESTYIKETFKNLEALHNDVIVNLSGYVTANGGEVDADETMVGGARQFFGELVAKVSNKPDEALVAHLEEAEDRCLHSISDAIEDDDMSPSGKALLQKELSTLQKTHDYMKALKDSMKEAA